MSVADSDTPEPRFSPHARAVAAALLVTVLWSSSWVLIKIGLHDQKAALPPLSFAGLRYTLAFLCLLPLAVRAAARHRDALAALPAARWRQLALLGVVMYALAQGAQFAALALLPSAAVSLLLNLTSPLVAVAGAAWLAEKPTPRQWGGLALALCGVLVYFGASGKLALPANQAAGVAVGLVALLANAGGSLLGRHVNRAGDIPPLLVTAVSMGIGAVLLLAVGVAREGMPHPDGRGWLIIAWLAVVNTAFAFTLWNYSLRALSAMESSVINSTMLVQICFLSWVFLGETLTPVRIGGVALTAVGVLLVQLRGRKPRSGTEPRT